MTMQTRNARLAEQDRKALAAVTWREELRRIAKVLAPLLVAISDERWDDAAPLFEALPRPTGNRNTERVELRRVLIDRFGEAGYRQVLARLHGVAVVTDAARLKARARQIANAQIRGPV